MMLEDKIFLNKDQVLISCEKMVDKLDIMWILFSALPCYDV